MSQEKSLAEQRSFPRVSASCDVKFKPVEGDPNFDQLKTDGSGVMNNISGGGISFQTSEALEVDQMIALEVNLPGFPNNVISMGKVCWCCDSESGSGYDVGVEFWWIGWQDESAQAKIRGFITDALGDERLES